MQTGVMHGSSNCTYNTDTYNETVDLKYLTMISAMLAQCEKSSARYNLFICTLQRVKVNKYGITSSLKILPKSTL